MKFPLTIAKATLLATVIFWAIVISEENIRNADAIWLVFISVIPIFLSCLIVISITVAPFFWIKKDSTAYTKMIKQYFPLYAITAFTICCYGIISNGFNVFALAFFTSAFFTTMFSWVWFIKHTRK